MCRVGEERVGEPESKRFGVSVGEYVSQDPVSVEWWRSIPSRDPDVFDLFAMHIVFVAHRGHVSLWQARVFENLTGFHRATTSFQTRNELLTSDFSAFEHRNRSSRFL